MIAQPAHNPLHRGLARCEQPPIPQQRTNTGVIATILAIIAQPQQPAIGQPQPPRSLNLQEKQLNRVRSPSNDRGAPLKTALLDRGAIIIGDKRGTRHPAPHAPPFEVF